MSRPRPPEAERTPSRIELHAGGLAVVVESTDPLTTVKRTAVELIQQLHAEQTGRKVGTGGETVQTAGFSTERPWMPQAQMPPELELPDRLNTGGTDDDRR